MVDYSRHLFILFSGPLEVQFIPSHLNKIAVIWCFHVSSLRLVCLSVPQW